MNTNRLNRDELSYDNLSILENTVLPRYKQWMRDYGFDTNTFQHGLDGVLKWSAENDQDIAQRYQEYLHEKKVRATGGAMTQAMWDTHIRVLCDIHPDKTKQELIDRELASVSPSHLPSWLNKSNPSGVTTF